MLRQRAFRQGVIAKAGSHAQAGRRSTEQLLRQGVIGQEGNQDSGKELSFWLKIKTQAGNQDSGKY